MKTIPLMENKFLNQILSEKESVKVQVVKISSNVNKRIRFIMIP